MTDQTIVEFIRTQLDEDERLARLAGSFIWQAPDYDQGGEDDTGRVVDDEGKIIVWDDGARLSKHIARWDPARVLREVEAARRIIDEHLPTWRTVEWDHDQNGKGEALCCRRCQNAEHSEWHPPIGQAYGLPGGFVTPYVLAPCATLRLLALPYADSAGYREWRHEAL